MCTVTFIPRPRGYLLGMNRDEQRVRPAAFPPTVTSCAGRRTLSPREPSGGTWIGLNDTGSGFALINWYSVASRETGNPLSRGAVVRAVLPAAARAEALSRLAALALGRVNPFRLLGFFPDELSVIEWRWNREQLEWLVLPWHENTWISSGCDEPGAQRQRAAEFRRALRERDAGGQAWLRRLHASHRPEPGPCSHCMHRDDAVTVSYTEIEVGPGKVTMRYAPGSPCGRTEPWIATSLARRSPPGRDASRFRGEAATVNGGPALGPE